ncbi:MAG: sigma-70 family RNA polymerase sigma factor, partial [Cellulomonas sp.]
MITAARGGDSAAFGTLYERHAPAARAVARQYTRSSADAEDIVSDSFIRVFAVVRGGGGPDIAFRAYLFTVVRRLAYAGAQGGRRVQPTDDMAVFESAFGAAGSPEDPALAGFERGVVAKAYASLPERWQAALWYTEIEQLTAAQIAPLLGLTANGVAALAYRAREGLRQAYLQQHLAEPQSDQCRTVNEKFGAYVRGGLAKRETAQVEAHLDSCGECRALVLELGDVNHGLRIVIAPLILGVIGLGALASPLPVGGLIGIGAGVMAGSGGAAAGAGVGVGATAGSAGGAVVGSATGAAASGTAVGVAATGTATGAAAGSVATAGTAAATAGSAAAGSAAAASAGTAAVGTAAASAGTAAVGTAAASAGT